MPADEGVVFENREHQDLLSSMHFDDSLLGE